MQGKRDIVLKLEVFPWVTVNMSRRNMVLVTKRVGYPIQSERVYISLHSIYVFFLNFHKSLLGTNEVLFLQKQPQVGTL